jgi:aromatic-L-amino-acid decarboxylase
MPEKFKSTSPGGGVIQDTASTSALTAVIAARERATQFESNQKGARQNLVAYISTQTHSSLEKAIKMAGIGKDNLRLIDVDETFAMRTDLLNEQIQKDKNDGLIPFFICGALGTTSSNAMDPLEKSGKLPDAKTAGSTSMLPCRERRCCAPSSVIL